MAPNSNTQHGYVHLGLYVDNDIQAEGLSDSRHNYYDQPTINAVVHVQAGQRVYLKNPDSFTADYVSSSVGPYTTFSGFLIRAD